MKYKDRYVLATGYPWLVCGSKGEGDMVGVSLIQGPGGDGNWVKISPWSIDVKSRYRLVLERVKERRPTMRTREEIAAMGLSSDCKLDPLVVMGIMLAGREHPCDRCNWDRLICRGYPRIDERKPS